MTSKNELHTFAPLSWQFKVSSRALVRVATGKHIKLKTLKFYLGLGLLSVFRHLVTLHAILLARCLLDLFHNKIHHVTLRQLLLGYGACAQVPSRLTAGLNRESNFCSDVQRQYSGLVLVPLFFSRLLR